MAWSNKKKTFIAFKLVNGFKRMHNKHSMQKIIIKLEWKRREENVLNELHL
jgi:hypothetical protein